MNLYTQIDSNKKKSVLLIIIFIAVVVGLGYLFDQLTNYGGSGLMLAIFISIGMSLFGYYKGDKMALWSASAKPIAKADNPYVFRMIENLCITAGVPTPNVYIIPDQSINAFACGRDPRHSSIAVTIGAIEKLENEELEGVLSHELSHVRNYDIRWMTLVSILVGIIAMLSNWTMRGMLFGGGRRRSGNDRDSGQLGSILMIVGIILMILSPIIAQLIQFAVSRKREFLADASGVLLTRYPEGLARALEKIARYNQPMATANTATAPLYISNPFGAGKFFSKMFSTHPPIEERVKALRSL